MSSVFSMPILDMAKPTDRAALAKAVEIRRLSNDEVERSTRTIVDAVKSKGDAALFAYARTFDGVSLSPRSIRMDPSTFKKIGSTIAPALKTAIREAVKRLRAYHAKQGVQEFSVVTGEGVLSQRVVPITRVGLYVPGGHTVYPSTVLMNVIPAQIAGVPQIVVATPCKTGLDPVLAFVFDLLNITEVYRMGGAHAVAAMAYGTRSVPRVDKIVGPGNAYVTAAKKLVYGKVDIDSLAGPSEVVILADGSADPRWVAMDLLSQAEHGTGDEMAFLVTEDRRYAGRVQKCLAEAVAQSPVKEVFSRLERFALCACVCSTRAASIAFVNEVAPEHLQIITRTCQNDLKKVTNAAAVFLGPYTPVPFGDYYIGTNHVLPTSGGARFGSPLGVPSFQKRISVARLTAAGAAKAARNTAILARAEKFEHHALSVECRA